jgi:pre-rRNA-processing protein TSR3
MNSSPPTLILRHQRENLKKCSLRGLEKRPDFMFLTYPRSDLPELSNYVLLAIDGEPLTSKDACHGLFLLDATWRYADKMRAFVEKTQIPMVKIRSIPSGFRTAYPRCQFDCPDPEAGLASIEALYIAYWATGRDPTRLLDNYHWKEEFLAKNLKNFTTEAPR